MIRCLRRVNITRAMSQPGVKYQFGVRVPRNYREAMTIDKANGNTLWQDAMKAEIGQLFDYETFEDKKTIGKSIEPTEPQVPEKYHL